MSCKFNSELLVAAFWTDHPKGIPPLRFWIFPGESPFPRYFPWGKIPFPPKDIPIPQGRNRPRAPIPPGTKCWFAGFTFCFEQPNKLSDYDFKLTSWLKLMIQSDSIIHPIGQTLKNFCQQICSEAIVEKVSCY
jgi:hypothetical protein